MSWILNQFSLADEQALREALRALPVSLRARLEDLSLEGADINKDEGQYLCLLLRQEHEYE